MFKSEGSIKVFIDTEFTSFNYKTARLLSIGLIIDFPARSYFFYDEDIRNAEKDKHITDFVKQQVLPNMVGYKHNLSKRFKKVLEFLKDYNIFNAPIYIIGDVPTYDWILLSKHFLDFSTRQTTIPHLVYFPIDFASILYSYGIDPDIDREKLLFDLMGIPEKDIPLVFIDFLKQREKVDNEKEMETFILKCKNSKTLKHNALYDAFLISLLYYALKEKKEK